VATLDIVNPYRYGPTARPGGGIDLGQTSLTQAEAIGPSLNGWQWSSVPGTWWAEMTRRIDSDAVSPYNANFQALMAAFVATGETPYLTGNVNASGYKNGNSYSGQPINQVSGSTPLQAVTYTEYASSSDAGPSPLRLNQATNGWPKLVTGTVTVTNGSPNVIGQGGSNFTSLLQAGDQVYFGYAAVVVFYTIDTVTNDAALVLTGNYTETTTSGIEIFGPFNRPPTQTQYNNFVGDERTLILVRDDSTGLPSKLYEIGGSYYDSGAWTASLGCLFDLATGEQRVDGFTSCMASGQPCMPFLLNYDEAASGFIGHPFRGILATALSLYNSCVWPALHGVGTGPSQDYTAGYLPMGARLRLNATWLAANIAGFNPMIQTVLTAMNHYGIFITDLSGAPPFGIDGTQDSRWDKSVLGELWTIPLTAFEVIDTVKPQFSFTGPTTATVGNPITLTLTYFGGSTNFGGTLYIGVLWTQDNWNTWYQTGISPLSIPLTTSVLSGTTTFTPPSAGVYNLKASIWGEGIYWLQPPNHVVTAS
jgi:hypothetical protein